MTITTNCICLNNLYVLGLKKTAYKKREKYFLRKISLPYLKDDGERTIRAPTTLFIIRSFNILEQFASLTLIILIDISNFLVLSADLWIKKSLCAYIRLFACLRSVSKFFFQCLVENIFWGHHSVMIFFCCVFKT